MIPEITGVVALLISLALGVTQFVKFVQDQRQKKVEAIKIATSATAERDSIVVKGAEATLLMMEKMLEVATTSERELRIEVEQLRQKNAEMCRELTELRQLRQHQQAQIDDLLNRMLRQERCDECNAASQRPTTEPID